MKRALLLLVILGCEEDAAYFYFGNQYEPATSCLDGPSALDVMAGQTPSGSCNPQCLVGTDLEGGTPVYVSTMCGPPPIGADTSGSNPLCGPALAALARGDYCLDGGGSSNPPDADSSD